MAAIEQPDGWLSPDEAATKWNALGMGLFVQLLCGICSPEEAPLKLLLLENRGLLVVERHTADLVDLGRRPLFARYSLSDMIP